MQFFPATGAAGSPDVAAFHDPATGSWQYVLSCPETRRAAIVDPVLDFDPPTGATGTGTAEAILAHVSERGLAVDWVLDTHPHADHLSAADFLATRLGARRGIGEKVLEIQSIWADLYADPALEGRPDHWDRLFVDGERFSLGALEVEVMLTPGHTLASIAYRAGDAALVHDTLMKPASGTSRADFPGGDAGVLFDSIARLLALPAETRLFHGHDYPGEGEAPVPMATVGAHRAGNAHVGGGRSRADYIALREERDGTLPLPDRMLAALQVNLRGGRLPEPDAAGRRVLRLPLDRFDRAGRLR